MLFNKIKNKLKYLIFSKTDDVTLCDLERAIIIYLKKTDRLQLKYCNNTHRENITCSKCNNEE